MSLQDLHRSNGAVLAQDGIPLHYGDLPLEYDAALKEAIILDRSHEGRIQLFGKDRFELLNRMSTNNMIELAANEGRPTIFTTPHGRIIDRIVAYNRADHLLLITEPGQGASIVQLLQSNIFFNDDVQLVNITEQTAHFAVHGPRANAVISEFGIEANAVPALYDIEASINGVDVYCARRKTISESHWIIITPSEQAEIIFDTILRIGKAHGLRPAGGIAYNALRIRSGRPARPELNTDYIPLEIGLWDEVSFAKGCYTGQEIIARMESRGQLAKTIVSLDMNEHIQAPAQILRDGRAIGKLTSSTQAPDGEVFALAVISTKGLELGAVVHIGEKNTPATIKALVGEQPELIV